MAALPLQAVLATSELKHRSRRAPDFKSENRALLELARELPTSPAGFLQKLSDTLLALCQAHSAGISLLEDRTLFRWHAASGRFASNVWGTILREQSPCNTVMELGRTQLMAHPERHFTLMQGIAPEIVEALLAPLSVRGHVTGTVWLLSHDDELRFDSEHARLVEALVEFAGPIYLLLSELNAAKMGDAGHDDRAP